MEDRRDDPAGGIDIEVGLVSGAPERLLGFYEQVFGFRRTMSFTVEAGTVYKLRSAGARLKVFCPLTPPAPVPDASLGQRAGVAYFALHVRDMESSLARAVDAGASISVPPSSHRPGARAALIRDPEGNVVELLEEPGG